MGLPDLPTAKPFQVILLLVFGFLAVIGLYLFANFGGFGGTSTRVGHVEIWGTLPAPAMEAALNELRQTDQEFIQVTYREVPADSFDQTFTEALATGTGPDLILISQEQLVANRAKISTIPYSLLSEREFIDSFVPITELFLSADGMFALPLAVDPLVLYYNRTTLAQAGIPQPPATWEGVLGYAPQLTQRQSGSITGSAISLGTYDNIPNARAMLSLLLLQAGNPIVQVTSNGVTAVLTDGSSSFGATPAQAAISFYTQFADAAKTVYTWNPAMPRARDAFIAGDLALYPGYASELPALLSANPNLDLDIAPIPQPQNAQLRSTYALAYGFAVPRATDNAEGALTVAEAITTEQIAPTAARALSMAPAYRSAIAAGSSDRYEPIILNAALIAQGWLSPSPAAVDRIFSTMIGNVTSGRSEPGQALQQADQALDAALR